MEIIVTVSLILTFNGDSDGAKSRSLFLHLSMRVNRPVLPVAKNNKKKLTLIDIFFRKFKEETNREQVRKQHPEKTKKT
jgi:hypothetical protein